MNCPRCGAAVQTGQTWCTCGQYVAALQPGSGPPSPPSDLYDRIEDKVERTGKDNFRRGLLIGLGFLALFLLLETIMDTVFIARSMFVGLALLAAAGILGVNLWMLFRRYFS